MAVHINQHSMASVLSSAKPSCTPPVLLLHLSPWVPNPFAQSTIITNIFKQCSFRTLQPYSCSYFRLFSLSHLILINSQYLLSWLSSDLHLENGGHFYRIWYFYILPWCDAEFNRKKRLIYQFDFLGCAKNVLNFVELCRFCKNYLYNVTICCF